MSDFRDEWAGLCEVGGRTVKRTRSGKRPDRPKRCVHSRAITGAADVGGAKPWCGLCEYERANGPKLS